MRRLVISVAAAGLLAACTPVSPERAADQCEERARAAQGPTGQVTVGVNNRSGGFFEGSIGITSDFLRGEDPVFLYERCVFELTGELPIRPPRLRDL